MAYDANSIKSLSFRDGVRTRIQMYLGSADNEGAYQAIKEILNNSTDEAIAGFGKQIDISIKPSINAVRIRDYGRGVPFLVKEDGTNVLVDVYTKAHTGGKFDDSVYKNVSGLNGIGGSCVCLSSLWFDVQSYRNNRGAHASFRKGNLAQYLEFECDGYADGTFIEFAPDPEVFKDEPIQYDFERICNDIQSISYLYSGITFNLLNEDTKEKKVYCAKNGIVDFVKDNNKNPLHKHVITGEAEDETDKVEIAFQWGDAKESEYVFVNGLRCPEGGSPITGARGAITRVFNSLSGQKFDGDSIRSGLFYVINCSVAQPSFANQTKSKINNANLRTLASNAFSDALKQMKLKYKDEFDAIVELLKKVARAEAAAEHARQQVLSTEREINNEKKKRIVLADKLKDCQIHGPDSGSVLAICEGDSALGALVQARPIDKVALLPIRGKIISALKHPDEKILQNEEVKAIFSALGCGFFKKYNASKLNYQYVAIASDQDADGKNIGDLIITLFYYMCPKFIEEGRLLWIQMPLFVLKYKSKTFYAFSDTEKNQLISEYGKPKEMGRKKGIGENSPIETREAVFGAQKRWYQLTINDAQSFAEHISMLMGKEVEQRKQFIMDNVDFSKVGE